MAVPFRRKSTTRIKKGRGPKNWNWQQRILHRPLVKCTNCSNPKLLHHLCLNCSSYRNLKKTYLNGTKR